MGERVTCACGRNLGATPRGMIRFHTRVDERKNAVRCPWSGRPASEVAQCMTGATDERIAKLIYAGRSRYPTIRTMSGETTSTGTDDIGQCSSTLAYDDGYGPETLRCARTDGHGRLHRAAGEEWLSDAVPSCTDTTEAP